MRILLHESRATGVVLFGVPFGSLESSKRDSFGGRGQGRREYGISHQKEENKNRRLARSKL